MPGDPVGLHVANGLPTRSRGVMGDMVDLSLPVRGMGRKRRKRKRRRARSLFVAPGGNDSWSGTLAAPNAADSDGPFASLDRRPRCNSDR